MDFEKAVEIVLEKEGGYVNHPNDPGGETNFGISKRAFPEVDIKNLTIGHAKHIYEMYYWHKVKAEGLPVSLRLVVFDCAVNQGPGFAARALQSCLGITEDGIIGDETVNKSNEVNELELLECFLKKRCDRYLATANFDRFGKGWLRRLIEISVRTRGNA